MRLRRRRRYRRATRARPRRWRTNRLQRYAVVWGVRAFVIALTMTTALYVWQIGWPQAAVSAAASGTAQLSGRIGLRVDEVLVEGRNRADRERVLDALQIDPHMPILSFDPRAARARLQNVDWIETASVSRQLPATIYVRLTEYRPMAVWQNEGDFALIDEAGAVIPASSMELLEELPLVVGEGAAQHAAHLLHSLAAFPDLADRMKAAVRVSERRWDLHLDGGIEVRLPEDQIIAALGRLSDLNDKHALFERDIKAVDLRLPDRLILRTNSDSAPPAPAAQGEKT